MRKVALEDAFIWTNFEKSGFESFGLLSNDVTENERRERSRFENALIWWYW